ncbi:MAG: HlyD family secretion protein [Chloroflexota bacterium]|nr:efflux RND transporter periplasmic adaptor subunit [Chloroflexota bacterium]MBI5702436.1 efflux RND transporter periplasmic adaptor subunit [Chloroflexota bacterium]
MKRLITVYCLLITLLTACGSSATPTPIPTLVLGSGDATPAPRPVSSGGNVVASAVLVPAQEAHLAFAAGGMVVKVNAKVGDRVTAGYILVELDDTLARLEVERAQRVLRELTSPAAVAAAEQAVANAQEAYDEAKKKAESLNRRFADNVTRDYLEAQVTLAQQALDLAREAYNRTRGLSSADPARAKAAADLYNAQKAYNTALANLNWFTEKPSETEVARITADLNAASAALQEAKWYLAALKGETLPDEASGAQLAQLQQARADLNAAQVRLAQTRLTAPIDGIVAQVDVIAGEYAAPGKVLIVLSNVDQLQVKTTDLSERDVTKVKVGEPAVILIDALNREFSGTVISISPLASVLGGDVVYEVTLVFDEQPVGALAGMTADVRFGEGE